MFTSVSLSLFRVLSSSFIFSYTAIASIFAYVKCIVSYCCSRENETWRQCLNNITILSIFYCVSSHKNFISITLSQISLKLHEHRGRNWRKKLLRTIFEEQFPVPRYTAASKVGNSVISLL